jgi:hydroxymethylglutaryl-CoA reductase
MQTRTSRLSGFYQLPLAERVSVVAAQAGLTPKETAILAEGMGMGRGDKMIENVIGRYDLPLGIGVNFTINGVDRLIPMAVEEPSVVAAVSFAARLARTGGGFQTGSTRPVMIAQVQLLDVPDHEQARAAILAAQDDLLAQANTSPTIARMGGGPVGIEVRSLPTTPTVPMLIVHLLFDVRDAMGANAVNTAAEAIAPTLERLSGGRALLRILSNLTDQRRAWAQVTIAASAFATATYAGDEVITGIAHANAFAVADPYRAATHNKGIFNGMDAVAMATGNDWRALDNTAASPTGVCCPRQMTRRRVCSAGWRCRWRWGSSAGRRAATRWRRSRSRFWACSMPMNSPRSWRLWGWRRTWPRCARW